MGAFVLGMRKQHEPPSKTRSVFLTQAHASMQTVNKLPASMESSSPLVRANNKGTHRGAFVIMRMVMFTRQGWRAIIISIYQGFAGVYYE